MRGAHEMHCHLYHVLMCTQDDNAGLQHRPGSSRMEEKDVLTAEADVGGSRGPMRRGGSSPWSIACPGVGSSASPVGSQ